MVNSSLNATTYHYEDRGLDIWRPTAGFGAILGRADGGPWRVVLLAPGAGMLAQLDAAAAEQLGRELLRMAELARTPGVCP